MLLLMKSQTEAMRALTAWAAVSMDAARLHPLAAERERHQGIADLMIPVIKGWCTETAVDVASLGIQVHGGTGFIEATGVSQYLRDARITPIYEGTTAIQANDLIGRKLARDDGHAAAGVLEDMRATAAALDPKGSTAEIAEALTVGITALDAAIRHVVENYGTDIRGVSAGAVPLLKLFGMVAGGWQLGRAAVVSQQRLARAGSGAPEAGGPDVAAAQFYSAKIATTRFYADHVLSQAPGLAHCIIRGGAAALDERVF
jgi:acyl-CoA dehydrogenase